jgi:arsenate reductase (thioredoxin)
MKKKVKKKKILFLCTGNSARSIMAEAIMNHLSKGKYIAYSAGSRPAGKINPLAIKVLEAHNIPTHKLKSKSWDEFIGKDFDIIVTVCNNAADESCPVFPPNFQKLHWDIPDPGKRKKKHLSKLEDFYKTYRMIYLKSKAHFLG